MKFWLTPNWSAGDSAEKRTMERDSNGFNWHTSSIINGTPKKKILRLILFMEAEEAEAARQHNNQQQTTSNQQSSATKILINEIQLASMRKCL